MGNTLVQAAPKASEKLLFLRLFVSQNMQFQSKWWLEKEILKSTQKVDQVGTKGAGLAS